MMLLGIDSEKVPGLIAKSGLSKSCIEYKLDEILSEIFDEVGDPLTPNIYLYNATGDYIVYGKK